MSARPLPARPVLWLEWIAANAVGYAAGIAVWQSIFPALRPALSRPLGGSLTVALFGTVVGLCAGLAQTIVLRRVVQGDMWIPAIAVGFAVGLVAAAWTGYLLSLAFAAAGTIVYVSDGTEVLAFGLLVGTSVGLARWLVLRRRGAPANLWLGASAVGLMIGYAAAYGIFQLTPPMDEPLLGAVFGACAGAIVAFVELLIVGRRMAGIALPQTPMR